MVQLTLTRSNHTWSKLVEKLREAVKEQDEWHRVKYGKPSEHKDERDNMCVEIELAISINGGTQGYAADNLCTLTFDSNAYVYIYQLRDFGVLA